MEVTNDLSRIKRKEKQDAFENPGIVLTYNILYLSYPSYYISGSLRMGTFWFVATIFGDAWCELTGSSSL